MADGGMPAPDQWGSMPGEDAPPSYLPVPELDGEHVFTVRIPYTATRHPDHVKTQHARRLARVIHLGFQGLATVDGVRYDSKADDGEHEGHDTPVSFDP